MSPGSASGALLAHGGAGVDQLAHRMNRGLPLWAVLALRRGTRCSASAALPPGDRLRDEAGRSTLAFAASAMASAEPLAKFAVYGSGPMASATSATSAAWWPWRAAAAAAKSSAVTVII
jgi:hypothetical protein